MAAYDSDSSGDEHSNIQTNVLLGFASTEPTVDDFSQLGGLPVWLDATSTPSGVYAKCKVCNGVLSLFLQLNADLPDRFPGHERRLYVLGCRRKACRRKEGSIRALRVGRATKVQPTAVADRKSAEQKEPARPLQPPATNLGESLFGVKPATPGSGNPFAVAPGSSVNAGTHSINPFASSKAGSASQKEHSANSEAGDGIDTLPATFAEKARLSSPQTDKDSMVQTSAPASVPWEPWPSDSNAFPQYYLDADSEYLDLDTSMQDVPAQARLDMTPEAGGTASDDKSAFESSLDKTFQRFADRLAQNPEQVLRYEFDGEPLLYSKTDAVGKLLSQSSTASGKDSKVRVASETSNAFDSKRIPRCHNCGASRVFEMQLTPHAITELEADDMGLDSMDWGTILIATCSKDCQSQDEKGIRYVEEWAGVQWEETTDSARK